MVMYVIWYFELFGCLYFVYFVLVRCLMWVVWLLDFVLHLCLFDVKCLIVLVV